MGDALTLSEDEASTELHKEHHSRAAGLNQRFAEAEREDWGGLIQRAHKKQQDEEERKNTNSNQQDPELCSPPVRTERKLRSHIIWERRSE